MDLQRTMEFILQQQANAEAEMAAMRQHQAEAEARSARSEAKAERQMTAIRKLIQTGMRMIVSNEQHIKDHEGLIKELFAGQKATESELRSLATAQKATETELRSLAATQKVTEIKLQAFIDSIWRGGNGSHRKN